MEDFKEKQYFISEDGEKYSLNDYHTKYSSYLKYVDEDKNHILSYDDKLNIIEKIYKDIYVKANYICNVAEVVLLEHFNIKINNRIATYAHSYKIIEFYFPELMDFIDKIGKKYSKYYTRGCSWDIPNTNLKLRETYLLEFKNELINKYKDKIK
jgi:hypothetical protein